MSYNDFAYEPDKRDENGSVVSTWTSVLAPTSATASRASCRGRRSK